MLEHPQHELALPAPPQMEIDFPAPDAPAFLETEDATREIAVQRVGAALTRVRSLAQGRVPFIGDAATEQYLLHVQAEMAVWYAQQRRTDAENLFAEYQQQVHSDRQAASRPFACIEQRFSSWESEAALQANTYRNIVFQEAT